jgi:hypothetical protein
MSTIIDFSKIKVMEADPKEVERGGVPQAISTMTKLLYALNVGQGFFVATVDLVEHKRLQRNVNIKVKAVRKQFPDREFQTRTLHAGEHFDKHGKVTVKELSLGIYRVK